MAKKLILLVGLEKTGTTSIQGGCRRHINILAEAGYWYPLPIMVRGDPIPENHSKIFRRFFFRGMLMGFPVSVRLTQKQQFRSFLRRRNDHLILSSEYISLLTKEEMDDVRNYFSDLGYDIKPICVIRKLGGWLNAMVSERVAGKPQLNRVTISHAIQEFLSNRSIVKSRIETIKRAFPATKFVTFDDLVTNQFGPLGWFFQELGIGATNLRSNVKLNERASDHTVRLVSLITQYANNKYMDFALFEKHPAVLEIPGPKFYLREPEIVPLLPMLMQENNWLKETFGERFYDEKIEFSNDPVTLNDEERNFLLYNFDNAEEPIRSIVRKYIAEH